MELEKVEVEQRTNRQNAAFHVLFQNIADHCLSHGIDQKVVINNFQKFETPVTPESVKETWRIIQYNMYNTYSTKDMTTAQVDKVYEVFTKFWSLVTKEYFPFPRREDLEAIIKENENK